MEDNRLPEKIDVVARYLTVQFPRHTVHYIGHDDRLEAEMFRINRGHEVAHLARVSKEFLDGHRVSEIDRLLHKHRFADEIQQAGKSPVLLTDPGVTPVESQN